MSYELHSEQLKSEGGLDLEGEDGAALCSEARFVSVSPPKVVAHAAPVPCHRRWWRSRRSYTAVRADGFTVQASAEAVSYDSQRDADALALSRAQCLAETQAAAGLIPLTAENGAPLLAEDQQQLTSEPIAA